MGIVDNIKKRMAGTTENEYDDAYADDGYYSEGFGSYDEVEETDAGMSAGAITCMICAMRSTPTLNMSFQPFVKAAALCRHMIFIDH